MHPAVPAPHSAQTHRRSRALRRLAGVISSGKIRPSSISSFLLPIVEAALTDSPERATGTADKEKGTGNDVVEGGILSLKAIAGTFG